MEPRIDELHKSVGDLTERVTVVEVRQQERFTTLFTVTDRIEQKLDKMADKHEQTTRGLDGLKTKVALITGGISIGAGAFIHWVGSKFK